MDSWAQLGRKSNITYVASSSYIVQLIHLLQQFLIDNKIHTIMYLSDICHLVKHIF